MEIHVNGLWRLRRLSLVPFAAAFLIVIVAGCGGSGSGDSTGESSPSAESSSPSAESSEPFTVVELAPLSGELQPLGEVEVTGAEAAAEDINSRGGILGREVNIKPEDSAGMASQAVSIVQSMISSGEKPDLVLPGAISSETVPILPLLNSANIWSLGWASSPLANDPESFPNYFGVSATGTEYARSLVSYLEGKEITRVAVVYPNNELGKTSLEAFEEIAEEAGIDVTAELVDPEALDVTPAMIKLRDSNPQALIAGGVIGPVAGVILKTRTKLGWQVPTIGDGAFCANNFGELVAPKDLDGVVCQVSDFEVEGNPRQQVPAFKDFLKGVLKRDKSPAFALQSYAIVWSALALAEAGAEKAKSTDVEDVTAAIESMKASEVPLWFATKKLNFSPTNHYPDYSENLIFVPAGPRKDGALSPGPAQ